MNADRNLLFGILAFQNNFIDRQALLAAFDRWTTDKNKPLGDILVEMGQLDVRYRELLDGLVAVHLEQHGNDPEKSLAAVSSLGSVRNDLEQLADPDVQATLAHVTAARDAFDPYATVTPSAGASSSAGSRFTILRPHAKGGLGQVSVARDEELNREVAFKEIQAQYADNAVSRSRFLLEAEVTGSLEHPGIVPVYGLGSYADGRPFYAMRFIQGDSLQAAIKRFHDADQTKRDPGEQSLELRKLLGRFIDVCNAIEYAHSRRVLHRDLKPGNIMLGKYGETLVVDWGLAKPMGHRDSPGESNERTLQPASGSDSGHTQMGSAIGTPQFMSPEQAEGRLDELGPPTDVYSLGATLYCLLTGRPPFAAADALATLGRVVKGDFLSPRKVKPDVPAALQAICLKAMALKPDDRYPSARALADDIERWIADEPVSVYREPLRRQVTRWVRNHKGTAGAAVAAIAVLVIGGIVALSIGRHANEQTRALAAAESVFTARAEGVPYTLEYLRPFGRHALVRLRQHLDNEQADTVQRLHAAYALADLGEVPQDFLLDSVATAPPGECRNLVTALAYVKEAALPKLVQRSDSVSGNAANARYVIVALHLGDPTLAMDALAVRSDPIHRTTLIHAYAGWHGDLSIAAERLRASDDSAFRSGLCAAFGTISPDTLEPVEREMAAKVLTALYTDAPDGSTHSAAGWALRQWKQVLPAIAPTSRPPAHLRWFVNGLGMTMVEVAAGKFVMGTAEETTDIFEKPAHDVTLTRPYYLGDREVTVEQFRRFLADADYPEAEKPKEWKWEIWIKPISPADDCPMIGVNWFDTVLYCNWLSGKEGRKPAYKRTGEQQKILDYYGGKEHECDVWRCDFTVDGYRLPTDAEWEYAARAGSSAWFCYGSDEDLLPQYAWFVVNGKSRTWPGGVKLPNAIGLFDMHGNVSEWCWDWRGTYSVEAATDPTGATAGDGRVLRGGGFNDNGVFCRSASRLGDRSVQRTGDGFRVLCGR